MRHENINSHEIQYASKIICCFEKSHYFSVSDLVLYLAVCREYCCFSMLLLVVFFSQNASGNVALTPRKERGIS